MAGQSICPNCGSVMNLGNIFLSGMAFCPKCDFKGTPISQSQFAAKIKKVEAPVKEKEIGQNADPMDVRSLTGKLAFIWVIVFALSLLMPSMRQLASVSILGILIFGIAYWMMGRKK